MDSFIPLNVIVVEINNCKFTRNEFLCITLSQLAYCASDENVTSRVTHFCSSFLEIHMNVIGVCFNAWNKYYIEMKIDQIHNRILNRDRYWRNCCKEMRNVFECVRTPKLFCLLIFRSDQFDQLVHLIWFIFKVEIKTKIRSLLIFLARLLWHELEMRKRKASHSKRISIDIDQKKKKQFDFKKSLNFHSIKMI